MLMLWLCLCLCLCDSENQPFFRKEGEIGSKSREEGEIVSAIREKGDLLPCSSPSLWPPGHHFFTICPSGFDFRKALCVFNVFFVQFYSRSFWKHNTFPLNDNERVIILYFLIMHFKKIVLFEWWQNRPLNIIKLQVRREQTNELNRWNYFFGLCLMLSGLGNFYIDFIPFSLSFLVAFSDRINKWMLCVCIILLAINRFTAPWLYRFRSKTFVSKYSSLSSKI